MVQIKKKKDCCGCEACANACPRRCIIMELDQEGFRYPIIEREKCIECNICERVCPMKNGIPNLEKKEGSFYAAYNKNKNEVLMGSSGGIFFAICEVFIQQKKGVVYGAVCSKPFYIYHDRAENIDACQKFRKSKYLQSHIGNTYQRVKRDLQEGRNVLYSGTPCQIAGLYSFLKNRYANLYTVEVICHGVPSEIIYKKYIQHLEKKQEALLKETIWRDKAKGWYPNHIRYCFENGTQIVNTSEDNDFQYAFLRNYILRPSCYSCHYAKLPRVADVSLADFWGYNGSLKKENDNAGISAVIVSSEKGNDIWELLQDKIYYEEVNEDYLKQRSRHVWLHPEYNPLRGRVFKSLEEKEFAQIRKEVRYNYIYMLIRKVLIKMRCIK